MRHKTLILFSLFIGIFLVSGCDELVFDDVEKEPPIELDNEYWGVICDRESFNQ